MLMSNHGNIKLEKYFTFRCVADWIIINIGKMCAVYFYSFFHHKNVSASFTFYLYHIAILRTVIEYHYLTVDFERTIHLIVIFLSKTCEIRVLLCKLCLKCGRLFLYVLKLYGFHGFDHHRFNKR